MYRRWLAALALVAAACSGGDDAPAGTSADASAAPSTTAGTTQPSSTTLATGSSTASTTPSSTVPPPSSDPAAPTTTSPDTTQATSPSSTEPELTDAERADVELARSALITLSDFPDGWVEDPIEEESDDEFGDEFEVRFDACLGREAGDRFGEALERVAVETGDFHPADDDNTSVTHEIALAADSATAVDRMAEVEISGAEPCLADLLEDFYRTAFADDEALAGVEIGDVVVTRTENERPADVRLGVLIEVPLSLDGETVSQFLEFVYQRQGRALSELSFSSFGQPFSRDGYNVLTDTATINLAIIG